MIREIGIAMTLVCAGFAFCLLVLELGLRVAGFDPLGAIADGRDLILREASHPLRRYELTPGSSGFAWRTNVRINSHGMRDREYPVERTGAPRLVVLGDSITFGSGVSSRERFTEHLEDRLHEEIGAPVEVLNLGVGGYDTLQEVATLEDLGLRFAPDLVILAYCVNDLGDNSPNLDYVRSLQHADSILYRLRSAQLVRTALDRLRLIRRLDTDNRDERFAARFRDQIVPISDDPTLGLLRDDLEAHVASMDERDHVLEWYLSEPHLGKLRFSLAWLRDLAREHGFEVIVAIVPFLGESEGYEYVYRMVERMAVEQGFELVHLAAALSAAGFESLRLGSHDVIHPNERGHRLIAEALEPVVTETLSRRVEGAGSGAASAAVPRGSGRTP